MLCYAVILRVDDIYNFNDTLPVLSTKIDGHCHHSHGSFKIKGLAHKSKMQSGKDTLSVQSKVQFTVYCASALLHMRTIFCGWLLVQLHRALYVQA